MGQIEQRIRAAGLKLPPPPRPPSGGVFPFAMVRRQGSRLLVSGHGPQLASGDFVRGCVAGDLSVEEGYRAARLVTLSILASIKRELDQLDRVRRWVKAFGMVNASAGFADHPSIINGFSELIIELWGEARGQHARSAVGVAQLPFNIPVEIEAEVEFDEA